jgi:hypothetical protein
MASMDSCVKLETMRIKAIVRARQGWNGCGGSSGQQASGLFGELGAAQGAFATRGRAPGCQGLLGKFRD